MKFFPYPITSLELREFCHPVIPALSQVIAGKVRGESVHYAANGFLALADHLTVEAHNAPAVENPEGLKRIQALPWDIFGGCPADGTHHHDGMNRRVSSWVALDDHSLGFSKFRREELFHENGRANLSNFFEVGHGRVAVPPQVLNLARKLPRAEFWAPRLHYTAQKFLPFRWNGGRGLIASVPSQSLKHVGSICTAAGSNPMNSQ